jgi:two-component system, NarL family, sensor histidine kinase UhpB
VYDNISDYSGYYCATRRAYSNLGTILKKRHMTMITKKLRALLVETSPDDARRTLDKLGQYGYAVKHLRVESAPAMQAALAKNKWDVVLCGCDSGFGGLEALKLMQTAELDLPFLFLSHDLGEENIIHAMQSGASDYIFKDSLNRLSAAIERSLREAQTRREYRQAQSAVQENQARLHTFIANLPGMACLILLKPDGHISFPYVSEGSQALLGLEPQELEQNAQLFLDLLHPDDRASYHQTMRASASGLSLWNWEGRIVLPPEGEIKWINLRCSPQLAANGELQWEGIMSNISQSKLAELETKHSQEQLRELSSHIQDVREEERLRIAREIHDDMGGTLTAIKLDIAWLSKHLDDANPALVAKAKSIEELVDRCLASANNISRALRPSVLDSFGIIAALEMEAGEFEHRTGISCKLTQQDEGEPLEPDVSIALFRIFQEALTNIMKHAKASQVKARLFNCTDGVHLTISDNGCGLAQTDRDKPRSFGLRGIQERVTHFGGTVQISGVPGQGTTVAVHIPRTSAQPAVAQQILSR